MSRRLSSRRAAKARAIVQADRCAVRPGITHHWRSELVFLWPCREAYEFTCRKCHAVDSPS